MLKNSIRHETTTHLHAGLILAENGQLRYGVTGQKQKWFLLKIRCQENRICMTATPKPEFDGWRWVSYWYPLGQVVPFKREVYRRALRELSPRVQRLAQDDEG
jgi:hypothetical protein